MTGMPQTQQDTSHLSWFRFKSGWMEATAIRLLTDYELRVLLACMTLASRSPSMDRLEGALTVSPTGEPLGSRFIANEVWTGSEADVKRTLASLVQKRFLSVRDDGAYRVEFMWEQFPSDCSTDRVRKHRRKKMEKTALPSMPVVQSIAETDSKQSRAEQRETLPETLQGIESIGDYACPDCNGTGIRVRDGEPCGWCDAEPQHARKGEEDE